MRKRAGRIAIAGTGSGCGKTTAVCAILQALKNRGLDVASFKCGPDYIDPMFHGEIIGAPSTNLDLYFAGEQLVRGLFLKHAAPLNVIEGAMGYYDGLAMGSAESSCWHMARALSAPTVLVVNARGMALSAAAVVRGFQTMRSPSGIAGVILNRVSPATYPQLKAVIERECGIAVYGYLPTDEAYALESRHLGLITAREVENLREKMQLLAAQAEKSIELDALLALMRAQPEMEADLPTAKRIADVRIAVAGDRAFCFYYRDNLDLLEELGATPVLFSPLTDAKLPECDGLYLGGGYPELYAERLSNNRSMLESVRTAVKGGLPTIAECGGFMYLTDRIACSEMVGAIHTDCFNMQKLVRFGYAEYTSAEESLLFEAGDAVRGHEFHHWDASLPGEALTATKPSGRSHACAYATDSLYAGFPQLYFRSNPKIAKRFIGKCNERKMFREALGH
ncbi:MAG: cobyrinate a,c-diamide synthase [Christensenellales bacterium]|jgi:cobyrinic acid a,c-diamide synthase